jgi:hypothetical protein
MINCRLPNCSKYPTAKDLRPKSKAQLAIGNRVNWQLATGNVLMSHQTSGSAQRSAGEPRQAGNGATVAKRACVAGKSEV